MAVERGPLSINSENMFPIIKKWLYSDHDIFYRELISNGCDAITKLKKLDMMGEYELPEGYKARIDVEVDPQEKTIRVTDNGLGMTADEVKEYINNIAFSGAEAFLAKYKDKASDDQIIGHFGLGFYSAFMVADLVEIDTLSWQDGAKAVHWECDGGSTYAMDDGDKKGIGTTVTLHLSEDCVEFSNYYRAQEVIEKYCSFMPVEIYLSEKDTKMTETIDETDRRPDDVVLEVIEPAKKDSSAAASGAEQEAKPEPKRLKIRRRPVLINDPNPLWGKAPKDCTDEEYKEFYRKVFHDYKEPLFWIHLNMDYPFNLKGILYFPRINLEYESAEGVIKLYNSQVFIADNIKEVIPEFLMLLKGVIDCPDLPLNVSRSALQNDGFAQKISDYISKKVAEKLAGMCKTDKENYDKYWDDISPFIKYGCLRDDKFCEKMTDYILFKDLDGKYHTLPEALEINAKDADAEKAESAADENGDVVSEGDIAEEEKASAKADEAAASAGSGEEDAEEKKDRTIYYVTDPEQQSQYVRMFRENGMQAFVLTHNIDQPFISQLEAKNEGIHFARIDADIQSGLLAEDGKAQDAEQAEADAEKIAKVIRKALEDDRLEVKLETLKDAAVASMLTMNEQTRRMNDMMKMYAANGMGFGMDSLGRNREGQTLILNAAHPLVQYVLNHSEVEKTEEQAQGADAVQNADAEQNAEAGQNGGAGSAETGKAVEEKVTLGESTKLICEQLYDLALLQNEPLTGDEMAKFITRSNEILLMLAGK